MDEKIKEPSREPDLIFPETDNCYMMKCWFKENVTSIVYSDDRYPTVESDLNEWLKDFLLEKANDGLYREWKEIYNRYLFENKFYKDLEDELK